METTMVLHSKSTATRKGVSPTSTWYLHQNKKITINIMHHFMHQVSR